MGKTDVKSYNYININYYIYSLWFVIFLTLAIIGYVDGNTIIMIISLVFAIFVVLVGQTKSKEIKYYNSLIAIAKYVIEENKYPLSSGIIENSANILINYKLNNFDKKYWEKDEKDLNEPYAISFGERSVFDILHKVNDLDIIEAAKLYKDFAYDEISKNRKIALSFKEKTDERIQKRYDLAEKISEKKGINSFDVLNEQDDNYLKSIKQKQDDKAKRKEESKLKVNFGFCPYCFKKILQFTRKCPHCTADL